MKRIDEDPEDLGLQGPLKEMLTWLYSVKSCKSLINPL